MDAGRERRERVGCSLLCYTQHNKIMKERRTGIDGTVVAPPLDANVPRCLYLQRTHCPNQPSNQPIQTAATLLYLLYLPTCSFTSIFGKEELGFHFPCLRSFSAYTFEILSIYLLRRGPSSNAAAADHPRQQITHKPHTNTLVEILDYVYNSIGLAVCFALRCVFYALIWAAAQKECG